MVATASLQLACRSTSSPSGEYLPMRDSLVASARRSERRVDLYRDRHRLHPKPELGDIRLGAIDAHVVTARPATRSLRAAAAGRPPA
jgi:hypothetical protein